MEGNEWVFKIDDWGTYILNRLKELQSTCDLQLNLCDNSTIKLHSMIYKATCTKPAYFNNTGILKLNWKNVVIQPIIQFMYTGILSVEKNDDKLFALVLKVAKLWGFTALINLMESQIKARETIDDDPGVIKDPFDQLLRQDELAPNCIIKEVDKDKNEEEIQKPPEKKPKKNIISEKDKTGVIKPLTSTDVFYKYANITPGNSNVSEISAYSLTNKQTKMVTELFKKNPLLFKGEKPIKIKVMENGRERVINVSVKAKKGENGKESLHIVHSPSSLKDPGGGGALKLIQRNPPPNQIPPSGPWLCKKCDPEISFSSYYACRIHYTSVHGVKFDSRLCEHCGYKGYQRSVLMHHMYVQHGIQPPANVIFPKCNKCPFVGANQSSMIRHNKEHDEYENENDPTTHQDNSNSLLPDKGSVSGILEPEVTPESKSQISQYSLPDEFNNSPPTATLPPVTTTLPPMSSFTNNCLSNNLSASEPVQVVNLAIPVDYKLATTAVNPTANTRQSLEISSNESNGILEQPAQTVYILAPDENYTGNGVVDGSLEYYDVSNGQILDVYQQQICQNPDVLYGSINQPIVQTQQQTQQNMIMYRP